MPRPARDIKQAVLHDPYGSFRYRPSVSQVYLYVWLLPVESRLAAGQSTIWACSSRELPHPLNTRLLHGKCADAKYPYEILMIWTNVPHRKLMQAWALYWLRFPKRSQPCLISFILYWVRGCFSWQRPMFASANGCEAAMAEAFIGLIVALGLGAYLVHALLHPEKY